VSVEFSADLQARMGLGCGNQLNDHLVGDQRPAMPDKLVMRESLTSDAGAALEDLGGSGRRRVTGGVLAG
jgi:hypothetical protein